jgi:hypothetical protein
VGLPDDVLVDCADHEQAVNHHNADGDVFMIEALKEDVALGWADWASESAV